MALSAKNYRFVSPGIVTQEIDRSRIPNAPAPIGPVIVGRAVRGPAFRPVTVSSFDEFTSVFGNPVPGGEGGDVWREGNKTSPMYGTYAAQAWLKNGEVLTYLRTLGVDSQNATTDNGGLAGWYIDQGGTVPSNNGGGAYGLFVFPSGTIAANSTFTGSLAAVWYVQGNGAPVLSGTLAGGSTTIQKNNALIKTTNQNFFLQFEGVTNGPTEVLSFSLDKSKNNYIRKVFNTDPTLIGRSTQANGEIDYFLGETFEDNLFSNNSTGLNTFFTASNSANINEYCGFITRIASGSGTNWSDRRIGALASNSLPKSGWIISQDTSQNTGSFIVTGSDGTVTGSFFTSGRVAKLFRFVGLDTGEWLQNNIKVSINNITPPLNENVNPYATFDVQLRLINDSDKNVKIVESFSGCTLNANSDTFIAKVIGDKYVDYDETSQRVLEYGSNPNRSKYVRVEMAPGMENGTKVYVPFGTTLPSRWKTFNATTSSAPNSWLAAPGEVKSAANSQLYVSASSNPAGLGFKISFPSVPFRTTTSGLNSPIQAYWGAAPTQDAGEVFVEAIRDVLRIKPKDMENYDDGGTTEYSNIITLDNVRYSTNPTTSPLTSVLVYDQGARAAGLSLTATSSLPTSFPQASLVSGSYKAPLVLGANKFTSLFYGGTEGFDITQADPLRNGLISGTDPTANYEYFTYQRAIDTLKNPEIAQYNLISIPGLTNASLVNRMITNTQQRADSLAVLDVPNSYKPAAEYLYNPNDTSTMGNVNDAVTTWKGNAFNNNYACAYYPWVQIRDNVNATNVWVPPSVVALGAMAYTDAVQAPWFAPAGFNRGGLSSGIAGLPVLNTALKLFQSDRDDLYNVNINPIASFPNEGIVIFGQKTLQVEKSALDRINVRRLLIYVKSGISRIASTVLFDQNIQDTWNRFTGQAEPFLADVKARFGLVDYKFVLDETTTTPDLIDQNILYAKVYIKPARAIEFIALDFIITNTGASFED